MAVTNKLTAIADAIRSKTGKTTLLTLDQMPKEINGITTDLIDDVPTTPGEWACLSRASQMRDIKYRPKEIMYGASNGSSDKMEAGKEYAGLVYSSVRGLDWGFIGFGVSMYSYLTALNNPKSVVYTKKYADYYSDGGANVYNVYGTNCSEFVSYCLDFPYLQTTNIIATVPWMEEICYDASTKTVDTTALQREMKLCDVPLGIGVHTVFVTGIRRDANELIQEVDITDSYPPRIRKITYSWEDFVQEFIKSQGYRIFRCTTLESVTFPENLTDIVYSDIVTNRGDKVCIRPHQDISLNVLGSGYAGIVLFKDGVQVSTQASTNDWVLTGLTTGKYTAILYKSGETVTIDSANETNSTSFIVCNVSLSHSGNTFSYTAEAINGVYPTPMHFIMKIDLGYTHQIEFVEDDNFTGSGTMDLEPKTGTILVHLPFKTEYGFVIAECEYSS